MSTEGTLTGAARDAIRVGCPRVRIRKINDRSTSGLPDTVLAWNGFVSWLEFKHLDATEPLHAKPKGTSGLKKLQLDELLGFEQQGGGLAWVVNYRKGGRTGQRARLEIYRPSALLVVQATGPIYLELRAERWSTRDSLLRDLRDVGVAWFDRYDHGALVSLIHQTHMRAL